MTIKRRGKPSARSSKSYERISKDQSVGERILIVTEGSVTEPEYFKKAIKQYNIPSARVKVHGESDPAPINVISYTNVLLKKDNDYEHVFVVFDRDRHTTYDQAIQKTEELIIERTKNNQKTEIVTSVPCFEVWFMLHVRDTDKPYNASTTGGSPASELIRDLKQCQEFTNYEKSNCNYFASIHSNVTNARKRAIKNIKAAQETGAREHHENPSSRVYKIIDLFEKISNEANNHPIKS